MLRNLKIMEDVCKTFSVHLHELVTCTHCVDQIRSSCSLNSQNCKIEQKNKNGYYFTSIYFYLFSYLFYLLTTHSHTLIKYLLKSIKGWPHPIVKTRNSSCLTLHNTHLGEMYNDKKKDKTDLFYILAFHVLHFNQNKYTKKILTQ